MNPPVSSSRASSPTVNHVWRSSGKPQAIRRLRRAAHLLDQVASSSISSLTEKELNEAAALSATCASVALQVTLLLAEQQLSPAFLDSKQNSDKSNPNALSPWEMLQVKQFSEHRKESPH